MNKQLNTNYIILKIKLIKLDQLGDFVLIIPKNYVRLYRVIDFELFWKHRSDAVSIINFLYKIQTMCVYTFFNLITQQLNFSSLESAFKQHHQNSLSPLNILPLFFKSVYSSIPTLSPTSQFPSASPSIPIYQNIFSLHSNPDVPQDPLHLTDVTTYIKSNNFSILMELHLEFHYQVFLNNCSFYFYLKVIHITDVKFILNSMVQRDNLYQYHEIYRSLVERGFFIEIISYENLHLYKGNLLVCLMDFNCFFQKSMIFSLALNILHLNSIQIQLILVYFIHLFLLAQNQSNSFNYIQILLKYFQILQILPTVIENFYYSQQHFFYNFMMLAENSSKWYHYYYYFLQSFLLLYCQYLQQIVNHKLVQFVFISNQQNNKTKNIHKSIIKLLHQQMSTNKQYSHQIKKFNNEGKVFSSSNHLKSRLDQQNSQNYKSVGSRKHQEMIEKLKKQTDQMKQLKHSISVSKYSRIVHMRKYSQVRLNNPQDSKYSFQPNSNGSVSKFQAIKFKNIEKPYHNNQNVHNLAMKQDNLISRPKNKNPSQTPRKQTKVNIQNNATNPELKQKQEILIMASNQVQKNNKQTQSEQQQISQINQTQYRDQIKEQNRNNKLQSNSLNVSRQKHNTFQSGSNTNKTNYFQLFRNDQQTLQKVQKIRFQEKLKQTKQRIMKNKLKLLQSQANFKLQKKIKENLELIEKQKQLNQIILKSMERQRQKQKNNQKKKQEKRLVHDCKIMRASISKIYKRKFNTEEKKFQKCKSDQSLLNMTFNRFLKQKQELEKQELLAYKFEFLKCQKQPKQPIKNNNMPINPQQILLRTYTQSASRISTTKSKRSQSVDKKFHQ